MPMIEVCVPVATPRVTDHPLAMRPAATAGLRIGWLDNRKANAGLLLREVETAWRSAGRVFESVWSAKNATAAAPDEVMQHLRTCDAVVLAIAD